MTPHIQENVTAIRNGGRQAAVIFLHGFSGQRNSTWQQFPALLMADNRLSGWDIFSIGYRTTLSLDIRGIWQADPPLVSVAEQLWTRIGLEPFEDYKAIALIAHSMGGLVAQRAILDRTQLAGRISHLILFGTPSGGLRKASWFFFWKRSIGDMADDGRFIRDLRNGWKAQFKDRLPFKFLTIAGDQDEFVPRTSSLEPFEIDYRRVVEGNHLQIVKPASAESLSALLVVESLIGQAASSGPADSARMAVESRKFREVAERYWPKRDQLDAAATVQLALALEGVDRRADAIELLEKSRHRGETDAMGVLAGRLKRRWIVEHVEADAQGALQLYSEAYQLAEQKGIQEQCYYHAINVAFMELLFAQRPQKAEEMAKKSLEHCELAKHDLWNDATKGEAHLHLGQTEAALESYRAAIGRTPDPWQLRSMYQQAVIIARHLKNDQADTELEKIFYPNDSQ